MPNLRHISIFALSCLALTAVNAAEPAEPPPTEVTINVGRPVPQPGRVTVITAPPAPVAPASGAALPADTTGSLLPPIPAAGAGVPAGLTPTPSVPVGIGGAQLPSSLTPGVPVKTYPTLEAAAKDGIDPLRPVAVSAPVAVPATAKQFDYANPADYLAWAKSLLATKEGLVGASLAAGLIVLLLLRKLFGRG